MKNTSFIAIASTRIGHAALVFTSFMFFSNASADVPPTTVSDNILTMPVVQIGEQAFRIDFEIVQNGPDIDIVLVDFEEVTGVDTIGAPSYLDGLLNLPSLDLDGVSFWGEFTLVNDDPITFRLAGVAANDPGESGAEGKWRLNETENAEDCGEGIYTVTYELLVLQEGNQISIGTPFGVFEATLMGTSLQWNASYPQEGGTSTDAVDINFSPTLDSLTGSSSWSWTDGTNSCVGSSTFAGTLLHN